VDKAATRRKFVLVKRDVQNKAFEVSEELEKDLKNLAKLTESDDFDQAEVQKKIDGILEKIASDSGGED
ncbi:unnamed protein product, partial [marine sediment metagenome]